MKPIIIDMKDMSDSREVYESRPNPVLAGFIYLILALVVVAFVWMYFSKMDIVVKATGTVAASEEVSTVTNQVAGVILERHIEDGQKVKAGDVLYTVSHEEQKLQLATLTKQLQDCKDKEEMLRAYEAWLEKGEEFSTRLEENIYYSEVASRKRLLELGEQRTLQTYTGELAVYDAKLNANTEMITYYNDSISKSKQLIEDMKNRKNSFGSKETYYWNTMENYLAQYQQTINQYDDKIKELQIQKDAATKEIEALEIQKSALQEQLNERISPILVSDGDVDSSITLQQEIQGVEDRLVSWRESKKTLDAQINQYQIQKNTALNTYEKESIAAIEGTILNYEQNKAAYEGTQHEYLNGQNTLKQQGTEVELGNLMTQEKYNVTGELESCRQTQTQLNVQIESLEQSVENATVKASIAGTVNMATDLVVGDYLDAGMQALTIIPSAEAGSFIVKSYVENKDIAKIREGMKVTYEIAAYPSREYGTMTGEVTFVSADLKVNQNGSAYYMVESSVSAERLFNQVGEEASLKVGMLCEAKIVIEEKSVLEILVEKLFHISK